MRWTRAIVAAMMKRKKKGSSVNQVTPTIMVFFSAISACLLLFLVLLLSLFAPSPTLTHHPHTTLKSSGGSSSNGVVRDLWSTKRSDYFSGCSNAALNFSKANVKTHPDRYLLIATSGGLNQQRTGITDAVVVAYLLNATLVVPQLDHTSFWKDTSNFSEIFDVDWFISFLRNDVRVIKELPDLGDKFVGPYHVRAPRKCTPKCYQDRVLPLLLKKRAVLLTKFDYRLSNMLDEDLQKLRCRVNYHALKFTDPIKRMGKLLVERMRMRSSNHHFIALHLRFEPDMLAFSGCYYGGGDKERAELGEMRKRWKNLQATNPDKVRRHGRCPLTPEEVGVMLRALGYGSEVHLYVASGEIYGGHATLAPLRALFPHIHSKDTLASQDELRPFLPFSSRLAALDFIVADHSDVFVTNNNGNMAKILAGRRRYLGHKPTIRPNAKELNRLLRQRHNMTWEEVASGVEKAQVGFMGEPNELRAGSGEFHENPSSCICHHSSPLFPQPILSGQAEEEEHPADDDHVDSTNQTHTQLIAATATATTATTLLMGTDQTDEQVQEFFSD